jgi:glutaredoxin
MKKYIVYGRSNCPYCIKVVNKLLRSGKTFYVEMHDSTPEKLEEIKKRYNHPTIPVVTIQDNKEILIGGCDDTIAHLKSDVANDISKTQTAEIL